MKPDLVKIILVIIAAFLVGGTMDFALEAGFIAAFACNIWLLGRAKRLHNWFNRDKSLPHAEQGVFYLLHRDINSMRTKHFQKKRELQKNLIRIRHASAALPDAVVITDSQGEIRWSNRLAYELLNIHQPNDNGQRINNLLRHPNFTHAYANQDQKPVNIDIEAPSNRNISINLKVIDLAENMQMIVARDITRHVNVNQAHKDFVSNVSHELKTPLTVMRGYLEIMQDSQELEPSFNKPLSDMLLQTDRMQATIEDLLFLAKLEGQTQLKNKPVQGKLVFITEILKEIMDSAQLLAEQNGQNIQLNINDKLSIHGNAQELKIAFSNLVTNAIRYTPKGGEIHIKWEQRDDKAIFSVTDTGIGIAPNHISRLTERFYRVDQGRSREKGGTGLGLAIVKNVLEHHNAKLNIESSLGQGSCFECVFNLK